VAAVRPKLTELRRVEDLSRPLALAKDQLLPVAEAFEALLPDGGLRRGSTIAVEGSSSTSLALGLVAETSRAGSWTAAVGTPWLGLVAAEELGVELGRFALIDDPGNQWGAVIAALIGSFDIVLTCPPRRVKAADSRRLAARLTVLVQVQEPSGITKRWRSDAVPSDVVLKVDAVEWDGLGQGHGHLVSRRIEVTTGGRGAAARGGRSRLWLPDRKGEVRSSEVEAGTVVVVSSSAGDVGPEDLRAVG